MSGQLVKARCNLKATGFGSVRGDEYTGGSQDRIDVVTFLQEELGYLPVDAGVDDCLVQGDLSLLQLPLCALPLCGQHVRNLRFYRCDIGLGRLNAASPLRDGVFQSLNFNLADQLLPSRRQFPLFRQLVLRLSERAFCLN